MPVAPLNRAAQPLQRPPTGRHRPACAALLFKARKGFKPVINRDPIVASASAVSEHWTNPLSVGWRLAGNLTYAPAHLVNSGNFPAHRRPDSHFAHHWGLFAVHLDGDNLPTGWTN